MTTRRQTAAAAAAATKPALEGVDFYQVYDTPARERDIEAARKRIGDVLANPTGRSPHSHHVHMTERVDANGKKLDIFTVTVDTPEPSADDIGAIKSKLGPSAWAVDGRTITVRFLHDQYSSSFLALDLTGQQRSIVACAVLFAIMLLGVSLSILLRTRALENSAGDTDIG
jgi:hypothetical protein